MEIEMENNVTGSPEAPVVAEAKAEAKAVLMSHGAMENG